MFYFNIIFQFHINNNSNYGKYHVNLDSIYVYL